ncbi:iron-containing alcohol dehydrogenase, partial [Escherichia coli]|nr:iron-containing alcohol dehydrogenase [Escherichia coli]
NPVSDNAALSGLSKHFRHLQPAVYDRQDLCAPLEMPWASYYGSVTVTHAGTHLHHALTKESGGKFYLQHGDVNAILLAPLIAFV